MTCLRLGFARTGGSEGAKKRKVSRGQRAKEKKKKDQWEEVDKHRPCLEQRPSCKGEVEPSQGLGVDKRRRKGREETE